MSLKISTFMELALVWLLLLLQSSFSTPMYGDFPLWPFLGLLSRQKRMEWNIEGLPTFKPTFLKNDLNWHAQTTYTKRTTLLKCLMNDFYVLDGIVKLIWPHVPCHQTILSLEHLSGCWTFTTVCVCGEMLPRAMNDSDWFRELRWKSAWWKVCERYQRDDCK